MKINDKYKNPYLLAELFHDIYEKLAPKYGYETNKATRKFNKKTPNGRLMIATCSELLQKLRINS